MPKKYEMMLKKQAAKKGLKGEARDAYVYGTLDVIKKRHEAKMKRNKGKKCPTCGHKM